MAEISKEIAEKSEKDQLKLMAKRKRDLEIHYMQYAIETLKLASDLLIKSDIDLSETHPEPNPWIHTFSEAFSKPEPDPWKGIYSLGKYMTNDQKVQMAKRKMDSEIRSLQDATETLKLASDLLIKSDIDLSETRPEPTPWTYAFSEAIFKPSPDPWRWAYSLDKYMTNDQKVQIAKRKMDSEIRSLQDATETLKLASHILGKNLD